MHAVPVRGMDQCRARQWARKEGYERTESLHGEDEAEFLAVALRSRTSGGGSVSEIVRDSGLHLRQGQAGGLRGTVSGATSRRALIKGERKHFGLLRRGIKLGLKAHLFPEHFASLFQRLGEGAEAFVVADQLGLATTSYQIVCRKPF
jgi:hypothetical protein